MVIRGCLTPFGVTGALKTSQGTYPSHTIWWPMLAMATHLRSESQPHTYTHTHTLHELYHLIPFRFKDGIKIIHFIGAVKPWQHIYHHQEGKVFLCHGVDSTQCGLLEYIEQWWRVYCSTRQMTAEQVCSQVV